MVLKQEKPELEDFERKTKFGSKGKIHRKDFNIIRKCFEKCLSF